MRAMTSAALVSVAILGGAAPVAAQADFQWHGRLNAGQAVEIRGINGDVRATARCRASDPRTT